MALEDALLGSNLGNSNTNLLGGITGVIAGAVVIIIVIFFALYIYLSAAHSKIGNKAKLSNPGIAWMPSFGPLAIIFETSKMHWWPFLMLTIGMAVGYLLMITGIGSGLAIMILGSIILYATLIVFAIMTIIWRWKTYETIGKPGWWALVPIISGGLCVILVVIGAVLGIAIMSILGIIIAIGGIIAHLVLIGIAAWSEE